MSESKKTVAELTNKKMTVLEWINTTLHNDEASTDMEMRSFFIENGLSPDQADEAIGQRNKCLMDMFYHATVKGVK